MAVAGDGRARLLYAYIGEGDKGTRVFLWILFARLREPKRATEKNEAAAGQAVPAPEGTQ